MDTTLASFQTPNIVLTAFGNYDGDLIALSGGTLPVNPPNTIDVYSTGGSLLNAITLQTAPSNVNWFGLTSDGTNLYIGDYTSGNIFEYSTAGSLLGTIQPNLGPGLTGVSYDYANDSLWVSNGITDMAYDLSTSGVLLSDFATNSKGGIAFVPGTVAPEPASFLLLGLTLLGTLAGRIAKSLHSPSSTNWANKSSRLSDTP